MLISANFLHTYSVEYVQRMWYSKFNTFTQSVDYVVKALSVRHNQWKGNGVRIPCG